jgi:hypothetical protein
LQAPPSDIPVTGKLGWSGVILRFPEWISEELHMSVLTATNYVAHYQALSLEFDQKGKALTDFVASGGKLSAHKKNEAMLAELKSEVLVAASNIQKFLDEVSIFVIN